MSDDTRKGRCPREVWKVQMIPIERQSEEAVAVTRVAAAAKEVQWASMSLEAHFNESGGKSASTLQLARLTAAISELQLARDALDALLAGRASRNLQ